MTSAMLTARTNAYHPESSRQFRTTRWQMSDHNQAALHHAGGHQGVAGLQLQETPRLRQEKMAEVTHVVTLPTHSAAMKQQPISVAKFPTHALDSRILHEISLTARGSPMSSFNPNVVEDLTRENTRMKLELMRINQGGSMLSIDQTLLVTQLQNTVTSLRVDLEEARETIHRQTLMIDDLKEHLDDRISQTPVARAMIEKGIQTDAALASERFHSLPRRNSLDLEARKDNDCISGDSLLSPTQPDLVLDTSPPNSLSSSELIAELKKVYAINSSLQQKLDETNRQISQLQEERASCETKLDTVTKGLEKKRDENRQWKEHAEYLETKRIAAQQDADGLREKLQDLSRESEKERTVNAHLTQEIAQTKSETQRLQRQFGYTLTERNDLEQQLNTIKTHLTEKSKQEVTQEGIIRDLRGQLQTLRQTQQLQQSNDNAQSYPSQQRHFNPLGISDYRAPFPQLLSHSPTSSDCSHGVPQANDIHARGVAIARLVPQLKAMDAKLSTEPSTGKDNELRPVWHRKEEVPSDEKAREDVDKPGFAAARQNDSGHDTAESFTMPSGLAADQYGPLQAWLKKQNMKPAFGGTYATHLSPTATQHASERTQHLVGSQHPSSTLQSNGPTFQAMESIPMSSVPIATVQPSVPTLQSAVPQSSIGIVNSPHSQSTFTPVGKTATPRAPAPIAEFQSVRARSLHAEQTEMPPMSYAQQPAHLGMQSPVRSLLSLKPPHPLSFPPDSIQSSAPFSLQSMGSSVKGNASIPVAPLSRDISSSNSERPIVRYLKCPQCDRKFDSRDFTLYREHLEKCLV